MRKENEKVRHLRIRGACIYCEHLKERPAKWGGKIKYYCDKYPVQFTWSLTSQYNRCLIEERECPMSTEFEKAVEDVRKQIMEKIEEMAENENIEDIIKVAKILGLDDVVKDLSGYATNEK